MFFSFDGLDGVGKTTQLELFVEWLRQRGLEVVTCCDPGSTDLGLAIRRLLLDAHDTTIGGTSEMLLFMAARAQMVEEIVQPALAAGKTVVSDRYLLANVVYQGYAGGLDVASLWQVGQLATAGVMPEMTFVLDAPPEVAAARLDRGLDRLERRGVEYQSRLRAGFLAEAALHRDNIVVIDAVRPVSEVQADIRQAAQRVLSKRRDG